VAEGNSIRDWASRHPDGNCAGFLGIGDRALLLLGFAAAFHSSEPLGLNVENRDFREEGIVVRIGRSNRPGGRRTADRSFGSRSQRSHANRTPSDLDGSFARERVLATLSGFLGGLSVLLEAIGLYGVMSWSVTRRTSEIGVRIALGAHPGSVMFTVLRESMTLVVLGTVLGILVALALSRLVATLLFNVTPRDALAFGGAVAVMTVTAMVATLLPAVRAAKVDPLVALRYE
jgi:ABC-type antimicrobial peptide transport system permease subunit